MKNLFGPITSKEDAAKIVKSTAWMAVAVGVLNLLIGFFFIQNAMLDGAVYVFLGIMLLVLKSRWVAAILLLLAVGTVLMTVYNNISGGQGGSNIYLAVILLYYSFRAVQASFKFKSL